MDFSNKNKQLVESSQKSIVTLHKSGKHWVSTILTKVGLIKVASTDIVNVKENIEITGFTSKSMLLQSVLATGAVFGGIIADNNVLAEEVDEKVFAYNILDETEITPVAFAESMIVASSDSSLLVKSNDQNELGEEFESLSGSTSESYSHSSIDSEIGYESMSVAESIQSETTSELDYVGEFSEPLPSVNANKLSLEELENVSIVVESIEALDLSNYNSAIASLNDAINQIIPIGAEQQVSAYNKYLLSLQEAIVARTNLELLPVSSELTQSAIDEVAISGAQSAIRLRMRYQQLLQSYNKIQPISGGGTTNLRVASNSSEGTILVFSESDADSRYKDKRISLIEGRLNIETKIIDWKIVYNPINSGMAYAGLYVASVSDLGTAQNVTVNGQPLTLDTSFINPSVALGTNLSTLDYTGRYYGKNYSYATTTVDTSQPIIYTFTTTAGNSLANVALYVQAAINTTTNQVHATTSELNGSTNLSGMLVNYKTSFTSVESNSYVQSTSESIQRSLSIKESTSASHSLVQSASVSVVRSTSISESLSNSQFISTSTSTSKSISTSVSNAQSASASSSESISSSMSESALASESVSNSLSESTSVSDSVSSSVSASASVSESVSSSVSESALASESISSSSSESTSISESVSSSMSASALVSESVSISVSASTSASDSVSSSLSESVSSSDSVSNSMSASISVSESNSLSESASASDSVSSSVSASASVSESVSSSVSASTSSSDSVSISVSASTSSSDSVSNSLSASASSSDSVSSSLSESTSISESVSSLMSASASVSESNSSSVSESASASESNSSSVSESALASESISISLSESALASDS
ncbi:TPA: hypothetical protein ACGO4I_000406, partial [Streptococcus suis]